MMHSWDGLYHLYGLQSGPASPYHGSKVTSVVKRKLGAKVGSRGAFPSPTTSPRQPLGLASALSKKTFCPGSARNSRTRRHPRKANHPPLPNEFFKTLLPPRPLTPAMTFYTHDFSFFFKLNNRHALYGKRLIFDSYTQVHEWWDWIVQPQL